MKKRTTVMTRIDKEQYLNLGILSTEYNKTRLQILNHLVRTEYQKLLEDKTNNDFTL